MAEGSPGTEVLAEPVIKILELQSKYGIDQETMLIYMGSVNLMSILNLIGRRYHGSSSGYMQAPAAAAEAFPSTAPVNSGDNLSLNNLAGMLSGMLGSQGGQGFNPALLQNVLGSLGGKDGRGLNPALLMSLLGALGGQNMDWGGLMNMLAGLMGAGSKPAASPETAKGKPAASSTGATSGAGSAIESGGANNSRVEGKQGIREVPKIMKWDLLGDRKRA
ncbi:MAG: hypothetical protein A4E55_00733 [Pelotomaculum sp. PtaU1.Bin035]|nr:MAG: hypothetical protein A4E55_00733 [Pelotomaculum sp. PtaU1.Bin035]